MHESPSVKVGMRQPDALHQTLIALVPCPFESCLELLAFFFRRGIGTESARIVAVPLEVHGTGRQVVDDVWINFKSKFTVIICGDVAES